MTKKQIGVTPARAQDAAMNTPIARHLFDTGHLPGVTLVP